MAGFSLTLLRHRLAARREQARQPHDEGATPRPEGRLVWSHAGPGADPAGVRETLARLAGHHGDLQVLTTGQGPHTGLTAPAPADTSSSARAFLDTWAPDIAVFSGHDTFPTLWSEALSRGLPLVAADVDPHRLSAALVAPMAQFDAVLTRTPGARLGPVAETVGPLSTVPCPPPAEMAEVERMGAALATRPVWYALGAGPSETGAILAAHRHAARMAHRLLLILSTRDENAARRLDAEGWHWQSCDDSREIASDTQILLTRPGHGTGLWLRLSPITFLGSTLRGSGVPEIAPRVVASLGSALIFGPRLGPFAGEGEMLRARGAAVPIRDEGELGAAAERLLNPAEAAVLAARGWEATSDGSEASARLFEILDDTLAGIPA